MMREEITGGSVQRQVREEKETRETRCAKGGERWDTSINGFTDCACNPGFFEVVFLQSSPIRRTVF